MVWQLNDEVLLLCVQMMIFLVEFVFDVRGGRKDEQEEKNRSDCYQSDNYFLC
jgi:hypothetical protein